MSIVRAGCGCAWLERVSGLQYNVVLLLISSEEPLDELAKMVASLFSPIPNRGREPLHMIPGHPFGHDEMGVSNHSLAHFMFLMSYDRPLSRCKRSCPSTR